METPNDESNSCNHKNPQMNDIELIPCPHCGKAIVLERPKHNCLNLVPEKEYVSKELRAKLSWCSEYGWQLFWWPEDIYVDHLKFNDVFNWINNKSVQFEPIGETE